LNVKLQSYLNRIGYGGTVEPDFDTLAALQEAHVCAVPFENLDVQLGRPLSIRVEDAYEKIVLNSRGGWCYEQNGLFGWALSEIGFDVTRIAASVMREQRGEASTANHLCLLVESASLKLKHLVDVGFGGSMIKPIVLQEAQYDQPPFKLGLERLDDRYWRFWEDLGDGKFSYDFTENPADESLLARKSVSLQSDAASIFVLNLVAQQRSPDQHRTLRGRVFRVAKPGAIDSKTVASSAELLSILANEFRLDMHEVAGLWPRIAARHEELFGSDYQPFMDD
jgi:N-hydroxyarylamine O-acetyltransferase